MGANPIRAANFLGAYWFRLGLPSDGACREWQLVSLKRLPDRDDNTVVNADFAPSLAEADAILAQHGCTVAERELLTA